MRIEIYLAAKSSFRYQHERLRGLSVRTLCALAIQCLSGCTDFAPEYIRPKSPVASSWLRGATPRAPVPASAPPLGATEVGWRDLFLDDRLRSCVDLALKNNRNLRVSIGTIARARAQYRIEDAARLPPLTGSASVTRSHLQGVTEANYSVAAGLASYELDFFSRVKDLRGGALQSYLETVETERSTRITLIADVATAWLTLAGDITQLDIARHTLLSSRISLTLAQRMYELGSSTGLSLAQAQSAESLASVQVASRLSQIDIDRNALDLLVGVDTPQALLALNGLQNEAALLVEIPAGLPAQALQNRPDVLSAEHGLQSAQLDIGAARAAMFPSITLTGNAGAATSELASLFKAGSASWTFSPSLNIPLFDGGAARANLDQAVASREIALSTYERVIQTAFREVADALAYRRTIGVQLAAQRAATRASSIQLELARERFRRGLTSFTDVLDAQRTLYTSQSSEASLQLDEELNRITLYRVLGGGLKEVS